MELGGELLGHLHPAGVGGDDDDVTRDLRTHPVGEEGERREVVEGLVEEALDLAGVEIDGYHAVGPGGAQAVGHEPGVDGLAAYGFAVLAAVAVEGADGRDALGGRPFQGVDHEELLPDHVVDGLGVGLDDEDVGPAHALLEAAVELAVGERGQLHVSQRHLQVGRDLVGQGQVRAAREEHEMALRLDLHESPLDGHRRRMCVPPR